MRKKIDRTLKRRLFVPLVRGKHPPEYMARGVLIGLLVAMTPTVGVQMAVCMALWGAVRLMWPAWDFNVVVAMAWTWITNVFTVAPIYYLFLVTGWLMMGQWDASPGYHSFAASLASTLDGDATWIESLWVYTVELFRQFGLPMFIGSIPWALLSGWLGYRWSLQLVHRVHTLRARRRAERIARRRADGGSLEPEA